MSDEELEPQEKKLSRRGGARERSGFQRPLPEISKERIDNEDASLDLLDKIYSLRLKDIGLCPRSNRDELLRGARIVKSLKENGHTKEAYEVLIKHFDTKSEEDQGNIVIKRPVGRPRRFNFGEE